MRDMLSFGRNPEGRGALGVVGSSRPRSARGGSGTRPNRLGGLPFSLLEAVRSLERVGGQGGDEEHDLSRENTGDGSTHHLPPNKPGQQKPSKDAGAYRFLLRANLSRLTPELCLLEREHTKRSSMHLCSPGRFSKPGFNDGDSFLRQWGATLFTALTAAPHVSR